MTRDEADLLREKLLAVLEGHRSYPKVLPQSDGAYVVRVVVHPLEDNLVEKLGPVETAPWVDPSFLTKEYVTRTPRTPSQNTDDFGFYPSLTRRRQDGPASSPDINPAIPGLRRIPDLQDLVRRVAMREDLKLRLGSVARTLSHLVRLSVTTAAKKKEASRLVAELLDLLSEDGHTGRHKIVKLTRKLQAALAKASSLVEVSHG